MPDNHLSNKMRQKQGLPVNRSVRGPLKDGETPRTYTSYGAYENDKKWQENPLAYQGFKNFNPNDNVKKNPGD